MPRAVLHAAPEVPSADDDADLQAVLRAVLDGGAHARDKVKVKPGLLLRGEGFPADLDEYALIDTVHFSAPLYIQYAHYNYARNHKGDGEIMLHRELFLQEYPPPQHRRHAV